MKAVLKHLPGLLPMAAVGLRVWNAPRRARIAAELESLRAERAQAAARLVRNLTNSAGGGELARVEAIERERNRMRGDKSALVDGSLGAGGPYDSGVTIASACDASKPPKGGLLMYRIVREFRPLRVLELGTNVGVSSAYLGAALADNGEEGRVLTIEASPYRIELARRVHEAVDLRNVTYQQGLFDDVLQNALATIGPVDLAFIDGHHQYQPTIDYFEVICRNASPDAVFVFDDIRWSEGMQQAWDKLSNDKRFGITLDLSSLGIGILRDQDVNVLYRAPRLSGTFA